MTEDVIGRHLYKYGVHDADVTRFLQEFLAFEDGDVVLDVGANIGWYSLLLDRVAGDRDVDIFAFEPDPINFSLLEQNVERNAATHVSPVRCAVADCGGRRTLYQYDKSNRGRHSLLAINDAGTTEVEAVAIDEFWEKLNLGDRMPRFIKMDIEGFEIMALRGGSRVVGRCPLVMLEYSPAYMKAGSLDPNDLVAFMLGHEFLPYVLEGGVLTSMDPQALLASKRHCDLFWQRALQTSPATTWERAPPLAASSAA